MSHRRYHPYRRRRRFRRSPLSDLIMGLVGLILLVVIIVLLVRGCQSSGDAEPATSPSDSVSPSPSPSASQPAEEETSSVQPSEQPEEAPWYLTLVNGDNPLPEDFTIQTSALSNGLEVDSRIYDALIEMLEACRAEGLEPLVCSAYRSVEEQTRLFNNKIDSYMADGMSYDEAYAATAVEIAVPGTSEHSLGLAVDICALSYQLLDESQEDTAEQQWLMAHCQEYGFILRYPEDKSDITGIIYEPWHYRYVGKEAAAEIMSQGICLEEYLGEA